jgi:SAM-dependent methyltransferase
LDIGCGIGDFLEYRPNTVGIDVNPLVVAHCRRKGFEAYLANAPPLPFETHTFDGVVMDNVLEHMDEPQGMLEDVRRVLANGGRLVVGVPGRKGFSSDPEHKRFDDETRLRTDLASYRFHCEKVWHLPVRTLQMDRYFSQFALYGIFRRID